MTECEYDDCTKDATGTVLWTKDELPREYCNYHIRQSRADYPDLIKRVSL